MDIKAKIEELEKMHAEQAGVYQAAQTNLIKIEGALEILREQLAEPEIARAAGGQ